MRAYRKLRAFLLFLSLLALQIVYEFGCKRYLFAQTLSLKIFAGALIVLLLGAALVFALFLQEGSFGKRFLRALLGYAVMAAAALLSNWLMRAITGASVWVAVWFPADILLRFFSIIVAIHLMVGGRMRRFRFSPKLLWWLAAGVVVILLFRGAGAFVWYYYLNMQADSVTMMLLRFFTTDLWLDKENYFLMVYWPAVAAAAYASAEKRRKRESCE